MNRITALWALSLGLVSAIQKRTCRQENSRLVPSWRTVQIVIMFARTVGRQILEYLIRQGMHATRKCLPEWIGGACFQLVKKHLPRVFLGRQAPRLRSGLESGSLFFGKLNDSAHGHVLSDQDCFQDKAQSACHIRHWGWNLANTL